ncbi:UNVERIFIED_CONTAM: hypothetical protein RMT77_016349 [Armadillidium vulgare]
MDYFNKMDGAGGYVRASLLGLSQGMSPLHDPLRLHPALHSQITDAGKDGPGLLRPLDYPHLPLLPFSAPPFLPPHLDPRFPFSHSAFHSLHPKLPTVPSSSSPLISTNSNSINTSIASITGSPSLSGSAFAPLPPKVSKMDPETPTPISSAGLFSHSVLLSSLDARNAFLGGRSPPLVPGGPLSEERRDSPSPMGSHGSRESPAQAREASTPTSPGDEIRVRKTRPPGECWCPVCGLTLRSGDFESHLGFELENLAKHLQARPSTPNTSPAVNVANSSPHRPHLTSFIRGRDPGYETYQRVKANREVRLRTKKRRSGRTDACPVCGDRLTSNSPEEIHTHVEQCFRRQNIAEEDADVDVEGDSPYDEFEWCGRRRIRVPSLLRSQGQAIQGTRDADVKTPSSEKDSSGLCAEKNSSAGSGEEARGNGEEARRPDEDRNGGGPEEGRVSRGSEALEKELESLKEKIRLMEKEGVEASKFLCLVCQRTYDRPAVSMICWHVFCEACWPHSMETKAECPQCSSVFNADDIRIIHL